MTHQFKGGRLPNSGKPRVSLTRSLLNDTVTSYVVPAAVDHYSHIPAKSWGMDGNDEVGDCTCAEIDHAVKSMQVTAGIKEVVSTTAEVLQAYSAITGYTPSDPDSDQGAEMQDVRAYWRKQGFTLGGVNDKILLFSDIDHRDLDLVKWCVYTFGEVGLGIDFPSSAMDQFNAGKPWDVVPHTKSEGGHAIALVGFDAQYFYVVTWGAVQKMTPAFFAKYVEEAWIQLSSDFVSKSDDVSGALYALGEQFAELTKQGNPVPAPAPAPAPSPAPVPSPDPEPYSNAFPSVEYEAFHEHPTSVTKRNAMIKAVDTWLGRTA